MATTKDILRGRWLGLAGGFRGRIDLDNADPALPFPFETGSTAVEGTLAVVAAATFDGTAAHGVAGTLAATAVATADLTGAHGVSGTAAVVAAATAAIDGAHGVAGTVAIDTSATASLAGAHGVSGSAAVEAGATVTIIGEVVGAEQPGGGAPWKRARAVRAFFQRPSVECEIAIVASAQVRMVGEAYPRVAGELAIEADVAFAAVGVSRPPIPLRALAPAARSGAMRIEARASFVAEAIFDVERMDEEDLLLRAWPLLDLAA